MENIKLECINPYHFSGDGEYDIAILIGSVCQIIEASNDGILIEVIHGLNEGFQTSFTQKDLSQHFKILR